MELNNVKDLELFFNQNKIFDKAGTDSIVSFWLFCKR